MRLSLILLLNCIVLFFMFGFYIAYQNNSDTSSVTSNKHDYFIDYHNLSSVNILNSSLDNHLNLWIIFTKVTVNDALSVKFRNLLDSIFTHSIGVPIHFNIISDNKSKYVAKLIIVRLVNYYYAGKASHNIIVSFYDVTKSTKKISDIVKVMTPHFSSQAGSYYSDALFYISLGLHKIAPENQKYAVLLDCDLKFNISIQLLFKEFDKFQRQNLFGLALELTSVYRHVLYNYRLKHNGTNFGSPSKVIEKKNSIEENKISITKQIIERSKVNITDPNMRSSSPENEWKSLPHKSQNMTSKTSPLITGGFPGFNSGVILLHLSKIRDFTSFESLLSFKNVKYLIGKYAFRGHLGDQDFYTLLGYEQPEYFYLLDCGWNRQLCKWWRRYEDEGVFEDYFRCDSPVHIYHGNCNTPIPVN